MNYFYLFFFVFKLGAIKPLIKAKVIKNNNVNFYLNEKFRKKYAKGPLNISYPEEIDLNTIPSSIVDIPLITNVIPVIWLSGKNYTIEEMDEDLYYSLIKIKKFFKRFFYNTPWEGELKPERLVKNIIPKSQHQSASLFSGGLDSTTTVLRHFNENLTLISFNSPHQDAVDFAKKYNFNFYTINMNYYNFLRLTYLDKISVDISKWFWDTTMGLSWVGAAAPFLYAKGISTFYIPSGFTWQSFIFPDGQTIQQPACPLIDENLSPMGLDVKHDVFTMTRTDKIKFISEFCTKNNIPKPKLVVCNRHKRGSTNYTHCNSCFKCYLTQLDILAIGENLSDYGFTLSEEEFIIKFKSFIENLKMRRGGTYVACYDTQNYLKENINKLPKERRLFYDWFLSINLWEKIDKSFSRPLREAPFSWSDYNDLYNFDSSSK